MLNLASDKGRNICQNNHLTIMQGQGIMLINAINAGISKMLQLYSVHMYDFDSCYSSCLFVI